MKEKKVNGSIQRRLLPPAAGYLADARINAIRDAVTEWKKASERIAFFKKLAQDERNVMVRLEALDSLYLERKHDPTIMPFIRQRFLDERSPAIKLSIINRQDCSDEVRAMIWIIAEDEQKSDEAVAEILERREGPDIFKSWRDGEYQLETEASVPYKHRVAYILRVARERRHEPDTLGWLKERAEDAECTMVRQTAIKEIAREWAREYEAASESLDAIPEDYAMPEVDTLKVNAIIFDTHKALEGAGGPFKGYFAKSAVLRLKELLGQPGAAEGLQSLHVMADLAIMAHFNVQN